MTFLKNKPKVENLDEKIYVLCYIKPRWITELAEIFYGPDEISIRDNKSTISNKIDELIEKGWLKVDKKYNKQVTRLTKLVKEPIDRRKIANRKYVTCRSLDPIRRKININRGDSSKLTDVLNDKDFRKLIKNNIMTLDEIIGTLSALVVLSYHTKSGTGTSNMFNTSVDKALKEQDKAGTLPYTEKVNRENIAKSIRLVDNHIRHLSDKGKKEIITAYSLGEIINSVGLSTAILVNSLKNRA